MLVPWNDFFLKLLSIMKCGRCCPRAISGARFHFLAGDSYILCRMWPINSVFTEIRVCILYPTIGQLCVTTTNL